MVNVIQSTIRAGNHHCTCTTPGDHVVNLELIPIDDPRLHSKTKVFNPRTWEELNDTVDAMFELMNAHDGIGLAAPQVGIMKRLFIMSHDTTQYVCINPKIIKVSKTIKAKNEGCLSYPGLDVLVKRPVEIRVSYQNLRGTKTTKRLHGIEARCFLHELDHLNGIVMLDIGIISID